MSFLSLFKPKTPEDAASEKQRQDYNKCVNALKGLVNNEINTSDRSNYNWNTFIKQENVVKTDSITIHGRFFGKSTYDEFITKLTKEFENNLYKDAFITHVVKYINDCIHYQWKYTTLKDGVYSYLSDIWFYGYRYIYMGT